MTKTIFEKSSEGQKAYSLPKETAAFTRFEPPKEWLRQEPIDLPEVSELEIMRHFCELSKKNIGIDNVFYPLGSCTMKYNPRINEQCVRIPAFSRCHPLADEDSVQGNLMIMEDLIQKLCHICGMAAGSPLPNAGAQGEFCGIRMIQAYHRDRGESHRNQILIPDDAHGTNPATAVMAGYKTVSIPTDASGQLDIEGLKRAVSEQTAGLMLTNPNTLGVFNSRIEEVTAIIHESGGLLYYDGANLNAILNICRPGKMGFDVMHLNLHKTFSTPHGGGGPGSGPVLCNEKLEPFLPLPRVTKEGERYGISWKRPSSIGQLVSFYGNFGVYLRAYLYLLLHGNAGLRRVAEAAVLNANYLKAKLSKLFDVPYSQFCMHEFVIKAEKDNATAYDIAKRLLDYGVHSPTVYFPLIVKECMLIEPTETENLATLDQFVEAMESIIQEIESSPKLVKEAPHHQSVKRLDEVKAARAPVLRAQEFKDQ